MNERSTGDPSNVPPLRVPCRAAGARSAEEVASVSTGGGAVGARTAKGAASVSTGGGADSPADCTWV